MVVCVDNKTKAARACFDALSFSKPHKAVKIKNEGKYMLMQCDYTPCSEYFDIYRAGELLPEAPAQSA